MVIAIDWDGTLVDSSNKSVDPKLLRGAKEAITLLRASGHRVVIFSANRKDWIQKWLNEWGIPVDDIYEGNGKLNADLYVDDKAHRFQFNGDWNDELPEIMLRLEGKDNSKW